MRIVVAQVLSCFCLSNAFQSTFLHSRSKNVFSLCAFRQVPPIPPPPPLPPSLSTHGEQLGFHIDLVHSKLYPSSVQAAVDSVIQDVSNIFSKAGIGARIHQDKSLLPTVQTTLQSFSSQLAAMDTKLLQKVQGAIHDLENKLVLSNPSLQPHFSQWTTRLQEGLNQFTSTPTPIVLFLLSSAILVWLVQASTPKNVAFYPLGRYDAASARAYFDRRIVTAALPRGLFILTQSLQFAVSLLRDRINNKVPDNEFQRGQELAELLTRLGPTFIKVGQSLSIRTDLLSPAYIRGLSSLQDQVPPFSTATAKSLLETEWGRPVEAVIDELTNRPIAAASLGQVYKARLKSTGQEVAIKVQRPHIAEQIALDMHLVRQMAGVLKKLFRLNTDLVGTVDAWGTGFVDELDYLQEARNAQFFSERIANTTLNSVVFAPKVIQSLTTKSVLVTEWVDGVRLDRCSNQDVTRLCSIAMNTYLTMLLDDNFGVLHADPHPGNILRTNEGRLCILDWGMVTPIRKDLQLTLIEHVAHLTSADYAEVPRDLLLLDFITKDKASMVNDSGLVEILADIYGSWAKGGGAASINVNDVIGRLQDLTATKGNIFQIPPYFAYVAKSFSVLEGIGLSNNPKYSIVNECLPYVSQRLLTDKDNMGPALSTFLFGPQKNDRNRLINYKRVQQLAEGFGEYTTTVTGGGLDGGHSNKNATRAETLENIADQVLSIVFTEEETPLQDILIEQLAKITASSGRYLLTQVRERSGVLPSGRTVLGTLFDPLGLWRTSPLFRLNELDEKTVETTRKLISLAQRELEGFRVKNAVFDTTTITSSEAIALSRILTRKFWERRMGIFQTGNRFALKLIQLTADTLDHGERDSRTLPNRKKMLPSQEAPIARVTDWITVGTVNGESDRLVKAKKRLVELTEEENEENKTQVDTQVLTYRKEMPVPSTQNALVAQVIERSETGNGVAANDRLANARRKLIDLTEGEEEAEVSVIVER